MIVDFSKKNENVFFMSRQRRCFYCVLGGCKVILKFILYFQTLSHTHTHSSYKQTSCLSYISIEIGHFRFESREISYSHTELIEFETMITTTTTLCTVNRTTYTDVKDLDLGNHRKNQKNEIQSQKNNKQSHPSAIEWKNNVFRFLFLTFFGLLLCCCYCCCCCCWRWLCDQK